MTSSIRTLSVCRTFVEHRSDMYLFWLLLGLVCVAFVSSNDEAHSNIGESLARIWDGMFALIKEFPYQAALLRDGIHGCGACIIHPKYLLTAAHCIERVRSRYQVKVGSSKLNDAKKYEVLKVQKHPSYSDLGSIKYDLGILTLKNKLEFGDTVKPIRLAASNAILQSGQMLNVSGWGWSEFGFPNDLRYLSVPYVDLTTCRDLKIPIVHDSMICAGYRGDGGDACIGDSGGPIVMKNVLYGLVSWGDNCHALTSPGVYTSIAYLRKWIYNRTGV